MLHFFNNKLKFVVYKTNTKQISLLALKTITSKADNFLQAVKLATN